MLQNEKARNSRQPGAWARGVRVSDRQRCKAIVEQMLDDADIRVGGNRPWDIKITNVDFFRRVLAGGTLALGESYMDGWWECDQVDEFVNRASRAGLKDEMLSWRDRLAVMLARVTNKQRIGRAFQVGEKHYDTGNDLFQIMLDPRMIYSCGYWQNATSLEEAQEAKLELVCRKLDLRSGMRVLDIGCGWGGTAVYIAEKYGAEVVGVTVSEAQAELARHNSEGLPVEIRVEDYRRLEGCFDRILSIGMFEHVGPKNYKLYMETVRRLLNNTGLFLLHTIGNNLSSATIDPWIEKYIFPNANLPSICQISAAFEGLFVMEDWHNFGPDYDKTLMEWAKRFDKHWPALREKYGERFYRMWKYYLLSCAVIFRARQTQLWQIVLSPRGIYHCYQRPTEMGFVA